jgi:hypothetical protein
MYMLDKVVNPRFSPCRSVVVDCRNARHQNRIKWHLESTTRDRQGLHGFPARVSSNTRHAVPDRNAHRHQVGIGIGRLHSALRFLAWFCNVQHLSYSPLPNT